jgi:hypothetical protein
MVSGWVPSRRAPCAMARLAVHRLCAGLRLASRHPRVTARSAVSSRPEPRARWTARPALLRRPRRHRRRRQGCRRRPPLVLLQAPVCRPATGTSQTRRVGAGVRRFVLTSILTCDQTPQVPHFWHKKLPRTAWTSWASRSFLRVTRMGGDPFAKRRLMWFGCPTMRLRSCSPRTWPATWPTRSTRWCGRAAHRHRLGSAGEYAGDRADLGAAARPADPGGHHPGRPDQHCCGRSGPIQSDGEGQGRDRCAGSRPDASSSPPPGPHSTERRAFPASQRHNRSTGA